MYLGEVGSRIIGRRVGSLPSTSDVVYTLRQAAGRLSVGRKSSGPPLRVGHYVILQIKKSGVCVWSVMLSNNKRQTKESSGTVVAPAVWFTV